MGTSSHGDYKDRFFGAAVYLFALYDAVSLAGALSSVPVIASIFKILMIMLTPVSLIYGVINSIIPLGWGSLIVFFVLFLAVAQNYKVSYFIRFNTMQSILIGFAISLIQIILQTVPALGLVGSAVSAVAIGVCLFCIVQCCLGRRPDIPSFSEFVYNYVSR